MEEFGVDSEVYGKLLQGTSTSLRSVTAKEILDDPRSRSMLNRELRRLEEKLDSAVDILSRINIHASIIVLLDTDVIRKYIEIDTVPTRDSEYVRYFFEDCHFDYALPAGTWRELLLYLSALIPDAPFSADDYRFEANPECLNPIATIEARVGSASLQSLPQSLEQRLSRLTKVVSHRRFVNSLFGNAEPHLREGFLSLLKHEKRFEGYSQDMRVERKGRDVCDAMNLAVAYTQFHKRNDSKDEATHLLLLTTTLPVANVAKAFDDVSLYVISPEAFVIPSELHKRYGHEMALKRCGHLYESVSTMRQTLRGQPLVFPNDFDATEARYQGFGSIPEELLDIEQSIAGLRSTSIMYERQDVCVDWQVANVHGRFHLRKIVDRLAQGLLKLGKVGYECVRTPAKKEEFGYKEYLIRLGIASPTEELRLRIHFANPTARNSAKLFWAASWAVTCEESQFVASLDDLFPLKKTSKEERPTRPADYVICSLKTDDDWYNQQILVTTSMGVFGLTRNAIDDEGTWAALAAPRLSRFAAYFATATGAEPNSVNFVEEIRVRIDNFEITFDFMPIEGSIQRYCTISGVENASSLVSRLYGDLGPRFVLDEALSECLNNLLKDFPVFAK